MDKYLGGYSTVHSLQTHEKYEAINKAVHLSLGLKENYHSTQTIEIHCPTHRRHI